MPAAFPAGAAAPAGATGLAPQAIDPAYESDHFAAVPKLHISKVAVGCTSFDALRKRQAARAADGVVPIVTRFRPKRADELIGGSIFWIVKHRLAARQTILGFTENAADGRTLIQLDPAVVPVRPRAKRAHQGWRYLTPDDAPLDLGDGDEVVLLPHKLERALARLALL